jgi:tetratricopeptide (TPR) repeat protein
MYHPKRLRALLASACFVALLSSLLLTEAADAQSRFPEEFKNLTIVPADIAPDTLQAMMISMADGLGVRCEFCHVREGRRTDYASDENKHKKIARDMMRMTQKINDEFLTRPGGLKVECFTCHRGMKEPYSLSQVLSKTLVKEGLEAMMAKYGELREEYYGRAAYDFGEQTLMLMATDLDVDAGLQLLRMNLEYYPESADTHVQLGNLLLQSGEREAGIAALEKAVKLDPRNRWARGQLRRAREGDSAQDDQ